MDFTEEKADADFAKFIKQDENDKLSSEEEYARAIELTQGPLGTALQFDNGLAYLKYIESIQVVQVGTPPKIRIIPGLAEVGYSAYPASPTKIKIRSISGNEFYINVHRRNADYVLVKLVELWKGK